MSRAEELREARAGDAGAIAELWTTAYVSEGEGGRIEPYAERDSVDGSGHERLVFRLEL